MTTTRDLETRFDRLRELLFGELLAGEALSLDYLAEDSAFMRFNRAQVRQAGHVEAAYAVARLYKEGRSLNFTLNLSGEGSADDVTAARLLSKAREEIGLLPPDPYRLPPTATATSTEAFTARLPAEDRLPEEVLGPAKGLDFVGLHSQGRIARGSATSSGARHWFSTENHLTDWSLWLPNGRAIKSSTAGRDWDGEAHRAKIADAVARLGPLGLEAKVLKPGEYRAYITPDAFNEVMPFFSWNGLSERDLQEGKSAYIALREGRRSLSPAFSLTQDFGLGVEPRFNAEGDLAPEALVLIKGGRLAATLVSGRSAVQYGLPSNAAPEWEGLRSAAVAPGSLPEARVLEALGTGVYVSNFHYLNWSDVETGRVTGMTRFSCFWVEGGRIVAPIKDMRFDESLYDLLGGSLEALTAERSLLPETASYGLRQLGGSLLPGLLVSKLRFTL